MSPTVERLRSLLRIDTTNPPGNEIAAVERVAAWCAEEGIEAQVIESGPGRANIVARLRGDGSQGPLLLNGHLDVVPVERDRWTHPPFAAEIHDGYLYGRGAIDMKNFVVMAFEVLRALKDVPKRRDLIFAAVADEEAGCDFGSRFLVEQHPELVRAEYALGEVGGFSMQVSGATVYPVMVAEKGVAWLRASFRGEPGHGSVPKRGTAVLKLARWVDALGALRLPHHVTDPARKLIQGLAGVGGAGRLVLPQLLRPSLERLVLEKLFPDKELAPWFSALLRNTATPTVLSGGVKINQIPGVASVELDGRTLPGFTAKDLMRELHEALGEDVEFEVLREMPGVETSERSPLYDTIRETLRAHAPGALVVPYMIPGYTDAKQFSRLGTKCYGFSPVQFPPEHKVQFGKLYHGHDERIWVDGFVWGTQVLTDVVRRFVCA